MKTNLRTLFVSILILCFSSCNFFEIKEQVDVIPCNNSSQLQVTDSISNTDGRITLINVEIDGVQVQRWVIIPDSPKKGVYEACNLPGSVKHKEQTITFSAFILEDIGSVHDTILNGLTPIEITMLEKY